MTLAAVSGSQDNRKPNFASNDSRRYPYLCIRKDNGAEFIPTVIDYDNGAVFECRGQNGDGEWLNYDEVEIQANPEFWPLEKL